MHGLSGGIELERKKGKGAIALIAMAYVPY